MSCNAIRHFDVLLESEPVLLLRVGEPAEIPGVILKYEYDLTANSHSHYNIFKTAERGFGLASCSNCGVFVTWPLLSLNALILVQQKPNVMELLKT